MDADKLFHLLYEKCFAGKHTICWRAFSEMGLSECYYSYYYAEARLYIIRDGLTDQLFFVKADSPKDAFMKFHKRMEDALNAGRYVEGGEYDD